MNIKNLVAVMSFWGLVGIVQAQQIQPEPTDQKLKKWEVKCRGLLVLLSGCPEEMFENAHLGPPQKENLWGDDCEIRRLAANGYVCSVDQNGVIRIVGAGRPCEGGLTEAGAEKLPKYLFGDNISYEKNPAETRHAQWYGATNGVWVENQVLNVSFDWKTKKFEGLKMGGDCGKKHTIPLIKVSKEKAQRKAIKHTEYTLYWAERLLKEERGFRNIQPKSYFEGRYKVYSYALFLQKDGRLVHAFTIADTTTGHPVIGTRVDAVSGKTWLDDSDLEKLVQHKKL